MFAKQYSQFKKYEGESAVGDDFIVNDIDFCSIRVFINPNFVF